MRIRPAPMVILSQDGRTAVCANGTWVDLLDLQTGVATTLRLKHETTIVALSPTAGFLAVAGYERLSCFACLPSTASLIADIPIEGRLFRLAVGDDGLVVGAAATDDAAALYAWRGDALMPLLPHEGENLGQVVPYTLLLDSATGGVLLAGLAGQGALSGAGERFVRLVYLADGRARVLWEGAGSPLGEPNGYLFPLAGGRLGIHDRERLLVIDPAVDAERVGRIREEQRFGDLETVVSSPDGTHIAWLWSGPDDEGYQVRTARLGEGTIVEAAGIERVGRFPALAVTNAGRPVLAYGERGNRLLAWTVIDGAPVRLAEASALSSLMA
jgi:hypothetical protein